MVGELRLMEREAPCRNELGSMKIASEQLNKGVVAAEVRVERPANHSAERREAISTVVLGRMHSQVGETLEDGRPIGGTWRAHRPACNAARRRPSVAPPSQGVSDARRGRNAEGDAPKREPEMLRASGTAQEAQRLGCDESVDSREGRRWRRAGTTAVSSRKPKNEATLW